MQFLPLNQSGWPLFLKWAATEGWTITAQELHLFQNHWRSSFFVLQTDGQVKGFVSAVAYEKSGWIGNLLVGQEHRGRGYGAALFDFALDLLHQTGLQRIWLTASEAGMRLYQRRGFVSVDRVDRWRGRGRGQDRLEFSRESPLSEFIDLDHLCWGESRAPLLSQQVGCAELLRSDESMALLQQSPNEWQLGPWLSPNKCLSESQLIVQQALKKTTSGTELITDVLASADLEAVLCNAGFSKAGSNELMCLTQQEVYLHGVVALASLGSIG